MSHARLGAGERLLPWAATFSFVATASGFSLALGTDLQRSVLWPTIATAAIYLGFTLALYRRLRHGLFGEIGFFFVSVAVVYTVMPAAIFILADVDESSGWVWEKLSLLLPDQRELGIHLWRHALFVGSTAVGYLTLRGHLAAALPAPLSALPNERSLLLLTLLTVTLAVVAIAAWSAPVETYHDHYTRFDHLSWLELRLVYGLLILKTSAYFILMAVLFRRFARYRGLTVSVILAICAYELTYSLGSRIETLSIMLGAACLYHYTVKPITIKMGTLVLLAISVLFSIVEVVRMFDFGGSAAAELFRGEGLGPASEFGAVFFTGFHLYFERSAGSMPPAPTLMLFNDLLAPLPFVDHQEWNPMYWYARHFFPDAVVPPATIGPIAESAVWGGEPDLALRGFLIGALYGAVMRWFLPRRQQWWALVVYSYLFATCVMTLKYSVLFQLAPLVRIIAPGLIMFWLAMQLASLIAPARLGMKPAVAEAPQGHGLSSGRP